MKQAISKVNRPAAPNELKANGKLESSVAVKPKLKTGKTEKDGKKERKSHRQGEGSSRRKTIQSNSYALSNSQDSVPLLEQSKMLLSH